MKKEHQSSRRDQYTVVLEDLRSQFKVFGESLDSVRDEVKENSRRLTKIDLAIVKLEREVAELKIEFAGMKTDIEMIKSELSIIRHNQITREEFKFLESRVQRLERSARRRS